MRKFLLFSLLMITAIINAQTNDQPEIFGDEVPGGEWIFQPQFSDEFDGSIKEIWKKRLNSFPAWSTDPKNLSVNNGKLTMTLNYAEHEARKGGQPTTFYFKSGVLRSVEKIKYGYFEVKMKGSSTFPGGAPAFWAYSTIQENQSSDIMYTEIDFPEIQSVERDNNILRWNVVHIERPTSTTPRKRVAIRQESGCDPETSPGNVFNCDPTINFDPGEEYHTYGCLWSPTYIRFYIDGKKVGKAIPNQYHNYPMNLLVSLGLREPHYRYAQGTRIPIAPSDHVDEEGNPIPAEKMLENFPITSDVEYIRVWQRSAWMNNSNSFIEDEASEDISIIDTQLQIYQNNSTNILTISDTNEILSKRIVSIYNLSEEILHSETCEESTVDINTSSFKSGIYIIKIEEDSGKIYTHKMIIN